MSLFSVVSVIEVLILLVILSCIIILIKLIINRKKMNKLDAELSHIRNINNIIKDEKYLEMTLPFNPLI